MAEINIKTPAFTTVGKASKGHGVKVLVYGPAGLGKTRLCGTAPKPIIISAEAGLLTFAKMIREGQLDPETPVIEVQDIGTVTNAYEWVKLNAVKYGLQTVCLDSISEIAEKCLEHEKTKSPDARQAYGGMANEIIKLVKKFRDLPGLHVLITAKQTTTTDPVTAVPKASPTAPGQQIGPALPYLFDEVFNAATGEDEQGKKFYYLQTQGTFNVDAKDRSGMLDEHEYPDFNNIISKISGVTATPG